MREGTHLHLELESHPDLNLARKQYRSRNLARCRVWYKARSRIGSRIGKCCGGIGRRQIGMVEGVKDIGRELQYFRFTHRDVFLQADVGTPVRWTREHQRTHIP